MSNGALLYLFRHNAWATRRLLEFCNGLGAEQLAAAVPGVYGGIASTLQHLIAAESYYRSLFAGSLPAWAWPEDKPATLAQMDAWALDMEAFWEDLLSRPFDAEQVLIQTRSDGRTLEIRAGVMLAQTLHHSNVHREQISASITALGLEVPDVSGWRYGFDTGGVIRREERPS